MDDDDGKQHFNMAKIVKDFKQKHKKKRGKQAAAACHC